MVAVSWKNNVSGNWGTPANWSTGTKPGPTSDVTISTASVQTITHSVGNDTIASLFVSQNDTMAVTGGTLVVKGNATVAGAVTQSAGVFKFAGASSSISGTITQTAGTLQVASGWLHLTGAGNSFAGSLIGTAVDFAAGSDTLKAGSQLAVNDVLISGATVTLGQSITDAGIWEQTGGTLALGGKTLTLSGSVNLDGGVINGAGTVAVGGATEISGLELEGSAVLSNTGAITQTGNWYLGFNGGDTSQLVNKAGATFTIANNSNIYGVAGAKLINAGTLVKKGGGDSQIREATTSTGAITVSSGTLSFGGGTNSFGGSIGGPGELELYAGTDTFAPGLALTVGSVVLDGASLTLGANLSYAKNWTLSGGTLALGGKTLTLSGNVNLDGGIINGAGTVALGGATEISSLELEGSAVLSNGGSITQSSNWYLGYNGADTSQLVNKAGATFTIANNSNIYGVAGAKLTNAGTLVKKGGGDSQIREATTNTGTITVASGTLSFGGGTNSFGGSVGGPGVLELYAGTDKFAPGLALTVGSVVLDGASLTLGASLSYAGNWTLSSGTLALGGKALTLSGSANLDGGVINGAGTVAVGGAAEISNLALEGSAILSNGGTITQTGNWYLGYNGSDTSQLVNKAGATFTIANNSNIYGVAGAKLTNAGTLVKKGGGDSQIREATTNTGIISVASGTLSFGGGTNSFGGTVGGAGVLELYAGTDKFAPGLALTVGSVVLDGANLTLGANLNYAKNWTLSAGTLALGGKTLNLSGNVNLDGGVINGAGTVAVGAATEISNLALEGSAVLSNGGSITQSGNWYLGYNGSDTSQLVNKAGATFTIANNSNIYGVAGATLTNAGTLVKKGGGDSQIRETTTNTGTITVASGTLSFGGGTNSFGGSIGGPGVLELYTGTDTFAPGLALTVGSVVLDGASLTLGDSLSYAGNWALSSGTLALGGQTLTLSGSVNLDGGVINGAGTVAVGGAAEISNLALEGSAILSNGGTITQTANWYLGYNGSDTSQLVNKAGATFTIANNSNIYGVAGAKLINAGTLVKKGGGDSQIRDATTNTGTITVASGTLSFGGGTNSFGGSVGGPGVLELYTGTDTFAPGLALTVGSVVLDGANLTLGASLNYAGNWTLSSGTLALGGKALTLSGSANLDGGVINGAGTVAIGAAAEINNLALEGSAILSNGGTITQTGNWYLGYNGSDTSQLVNKAGATFTIANNSDINGIAGAKLTNAGTLVKKGGSGLTTVQATTVNTGHIEIGSGSMTFLAPVSGTGTFDVQAGALTFGAAVAAGTTVNLGTDTDLTVQALAAFAGTISGFAAGDFIGIAGLGFSGASLAFNAATDKVTVTNGATSASLQLAGSYTAADFYLFNNNGNAAIGHV